MSRFSPNSLQPTCEVDISGLSGRLAIPMAHAVLCTHSSCSPRSPSLPPSPSVPVTHELWCILHAFGFDVSVLFSLQRYLFFSLAHLFSLESHLPSATPSHLSPPNHRLLASNPNFDSYFDGLRDLSLLWSSGIQMPLSKKRNLQQHPSPSVLRQRSHSSPRSQPFALPLPLRPLFFLLQLSSSLGIIHH